MDDQELDAKDGRLLNAYLVTGSLPEAARLVGIDRTTAWRRAKKAVFQAEVRRRLDEQRRRAQAALAARQDASWAALDAALASVDERIRLRAATWVLQRLLTPEEATSASVTTAVDVELEQAQATLVRMLAGERGSR